MDNSKIIKLVKPVLFGILFLLVFIFLFSILGEDQEILKSTKESKSVNFGFTITFTLITIAILSVIAMVVIGLTNKPKAAIVSLVGLVAIVVLYFIGYSMDSGELLQSYTKGGVIETQSQSKMVGGVLNATLFVLLIAVGFSFATSIKDLINKLS